MQVSRASVVETLTQVLDEFKSVLNARPQLRKYGAVACVGVGLLLSRLLFIRLKRAVSKSPPGLYGLPFVGSLVTMMIWKQDFALKLLPRYGDLATFSIGPLQFCKISDVEVANKVLTFAKNRPEFLQLFDEDIGIEGSFGDINAGNMWGYRRRKMMHDLAVVLKSESFEENYSKILKNITYEYLDTRLKTSANKHGSYDWYPRELIRNMTTNSMYLAMFGKTVDIESEKYKNICASLKGCIDNIAQALFKFTLPSFIGVPVFGKEYNRYIKFINSSYDIIRSDYQKTKNGKAMENTKTLADYYIEDNQLSEERCVADLFVIMVAGTDTTAHVSEVGVALLAKYPTVQNQIYNELKSNMSAGDESFRLRLIQKCPLLRAFVAEALRLGRTVPNSAYRRCDHDIRCIKLKNNKIVCDVVEANVWQKYDNSKTFNKNDILYDYVLSKDCLFEPNLDYFLTNKQTWNLGGNSAKMNLSYWLKKDEKGQVKFSWNKQAIPFSTGARECPGQSLARKQLHAFFANLLLIYEIQQTESDAKKPNDGILPIQINVGDATAQIDPVCVQIRKR